MKEYIKKAIPVKAKLFQKGDEDRMAGDIAVVETLEGKLLYGEFGQHYIVFGNHNDKWLVRKDIFEDTYEEIIKQEPYTT